MTERITGLSIHVYADCYNIIISANKCDDRILDKYEMDAIKNLNNLAPAHKYDIVMQQIPSRTNNNFDVFIRDRSYNSAGFKQLFHFFKDFKDRAWRINFSRVTDIDLFDIYAILRQYTNIKILSLCECSYIADSLENKLVLCKIYELRISNSNLLNFPILPKKLTILNFCYNKLAALNNTIVLPETLEKLCVDYNNIEIVDFDHKNIEEITIHGNRIIELRNVPSKVKRIGWNTNGIQIETMLDIDTFCAENKEYSPKIIKTIQKYYNKKYDFNLPVRVRVRRRENTIYVNPIKYICRLPRATCRDLRVVPYILANESVENVVWMNNFDDVEEMLLVLFGYPDLINIIRDYSISPVFILPGRNSANNI